MFKSEANHKRKFALQLISIYFDVTLPHQSDVVAKIVAHLQLNDARSIYGGYGSPKEEKKNCNL